ncbi:MAG: hypothetical protein WKF90_12255 [Pyrinomonadaceae bacterium]
MTGKEKPPNGKEESNGEIQQSRIENKVKEMHNNIRHISLLAVNWYVFFVTINYASMGWLAVGNASFPKCIIVVIALAFIVQNILGIFALSKTEKVVKKMSNQVACYENQPINKGKIEAKSIPTELYKCLQICMSLVLISLILAWGIYAYIRFNY